MAVKGHGRNLSPEMKAGIIMVLCQMTNTTINVFNKLVSSDGMSLRVAVAYVFMFSSALLIPAALIFERGKIPKITWSILLYAFFCGLFGGTLGQNLYLQSLSLTSATFASALTNLTPAFTFILALCFRMENLNLGKAAGQAKVLGTLISLGGAMILTFYKGIAFDFLNTGINLLSITSSYGHGHVSSTPSSPTIGRQVLGAFCGIGSCLSYSMWTILQRKMSMKCPCFYTNASLVSVMGMIQVIVFSLCTERDMSQWRLGWNLRLLGVAFMGLGGALVLMFFSWGTTIKDPVFLSSFHPLMPIMVAVVGVLFLNEGLYLGSVLGAIVMVIGLYTVLWGKHKEKKENELLLVASEKLKESVDVVIEVGEKKSVSDEDQTQEHKQNGPGT